MLSVSAAAQSPCSCPPFLPATSQHPHLFPPPPPPPPTDVSLVIFTDSAGVVVLVSRPLSVLAVARADLPTHPHWVGVTRFSCLSPAHPQCTQNLPHNTVPEVLALNTAHYEAKPTSFAFQEVEKRLEVTHKNDENCAMTQHSAGQRTNRGGEYTQMICGRTSPAFYDGKVGKSAGGTFSEEVLQRETLPFGLTHLTLCELSQDSRLLP